MRLCRSIFVLPLMLAAALPARAVSSSADAPHVHVQLLLDSAHLYRSEPVYAGLYFKLEPGWHVYWKNPGDAGEPPHIKWTLPNGVTAGPLQFAPPKRLPLGPLMDFGYEDQVLFPTELDVAETAPLGPAVIHAKVDWLVCRESCIPGKAELELNQDVRLNPGGGLRQGPNDSGLWFRAWKPLPDSTQKTLHTTFQPVAGGLRLSVDTGERETQADFFPSDQDILDNPAPQKFTSTPRGLILDLKKDANLTASPAALKGVLELSRGRAFEIVALPGSVAAQPGPGPVATGSNSSEKQASGAKAPDLSTAADTGAKAPAYQASAAAAPPQGGAATGSVLTAPARVEGVGLLRAAGLAFLGGLLLNLMPCVFPVLFLKGLSLVNSGNTERHKLRAHGLVYAAGILASFWALVAVLLGLRAAGATLGWGFQFQSPVFLELMAGLLFFLGLSLAGQFEIGLRLTSVGGALVTENGAARQGYAGSFFTGVLAVVVATPCTAPFMGAALGYALAQNAAVTFAVFTALALGLAAPYVALTLQPAWTRLLPKPGAWMEVLRQAVAVPIFATVIWLAWVLAATYGASLLAALLASFLLLAIAGWFLGRWPAKRWAAAVATAILLAVVALAFLSQRAAEEDKEQAGVIADLVGSGQIETADLKSANPSAWQPWSAEAVTRAQAAGRPVLVDFTAKWCLSCQVNERLALDRPEVEQSLADAHVALFKADWTRHDEAITQALASLGRSGVPAYALYAPGETSPRLLPEALTPGIVLDALSKLPKADAAQSR